MRLMVTGAAGQLGSTIAARFSSSAEVLAFTRQQLDIADDAAVLRAVSDARPDVVINCAAYTDVDGAEDHPVQALEVNAFGVMSLARAAAAAGALLVHYSTDFVFDGTADRPYVETDPPRPLSHYAASKLLGEWFASEAAACYVLRVESLFGGQPAKSSVDRILAAIRQGEQVRAFIDRFVTPSYLEDVAAATEMLLDRRPAFGLYHCVNSGGTTWMDIADKCAELLGREAEIVPIRLEDTRLKAARPRFCALSNQKLADAGMTMPSWQNALARYLQKTGWGGELGH